MKRVKYYEISSEEYALCSGDALQIIESGTLPKLFGSSKEGSLYTTDYYCKTHNLPVIELRYPNKESEYLCIGPRLLEKLDSVLGEKYKKRIDKINEEYATALRQANDKIRYAEQGWDKECKTLQNFSRLPWHKRLYVAWTRKL